jgi:hypothetical protein
MQEKIQILPQSGEHEVSQPQQEKTVEPAQEPKTAQEDKTSKDGSKPTPKPKT